MHISQSCSIILSFIMPRYYLVLLNMPNKNAHKHYGSFTPSLHQTLIFLLGSVINGLVLGVEIPVIIEIQHWQILVGSWHKLNI